MIFRKFSVAILVLIITAVILMLVNQFSALNGGLPSLPAAYSSTVIGCIALSMVCNFSIIISGAIGFFVILLGDDSKAVKNSKNFILILFILFGFQQFFASIAGNELAKYIYEYYGYVYSPSASFIISLIILIFVLVMSIISIFNKIDRVNYILGLASSSLLFILMIISIATNSESNLKGIDIAARIFYFISFIGCGIYFILCLLNLEPAPSSTSVSNNGVGMRGFADNYTEGSHINSQPQQPIVQSNKDASEELIKIKKLYDAGIITAEEYEEKRKKYVGML